MVNPPADDSMIGKPGRPEKLTQDIRRQIMSLRRNGKRRLNAPAIQNELRVWLQLKHKNWTREDVEQNLPGVDSIRKYINKREPEKDKEDPEDSPWYIGAIIDNNIPASALPFIEMTQEWQTAHPEDEYHRSRPGLTIRHAKWIGVLHSLYSVELVRKAKGKERDGLAGWFYQWSRAYAAFETSSLISGISNVTSDLDKGMRERAWPIVTGNAILLLFPDHSFDIITGDPQLISQMERDGEA